MKRTLLVIAVLLAVTATALQAQGPDIMYLRFNEGTGTTTADLAIPGIASTPTLIGACGWNTGNAPLGAACLQPGPGMNDSIDTGVALNLTGDWTVEFWERDTFVSPISPLLARHVLSDGTNTGLAAFHKNILGFTNHDMVFVPSPNNGFTIPQSIVPNQWVHFAFVYNFTLNKLDGYVNGVYSNSQTYGAAVPLMTAPGTNLRVGGYVSGASWGGQIDELRIWNSARSAADILANYNIEIPLFTTNVKVDSVDGPLSPTGACVLSSATEVISCTVRNQSSAAIVAGTLIPIEYSIDGGPATPDFVFVPVGDLAAGATMPFSFATPADLSAPGTHTVTVTAMLPGDQNAADDSASRNVVSGGQGRVVSFPWTENFDGLNSVSTTPPLGWAQETTDSTGTNSDWFFRSGQAATLITSPTGDHTSGSGIYAYVEDSSANFANVSLRTPCLDLAGLTNPALGFWFHSQDDSAGLNTNPMSIDVVMQPVGTVTLDVFGPEGNIGMGWMARSVDLSAFAGQTIQLIFRGRSDGGSAKNDTAIDDVTVYDTVPTPGQPPVAGTAVLDLNGALNGNGSPVPLLANGPYFTGSTSGSTLFFSFEGEMNRPFALLIGPLNPVAATYPNVGQLDIGGAVNAMTGVPGFIQVLGDGFNPVDFFDLLFNSGPTGSTSMSFPTPNLPLGPIGTFQTLFSTGNGFFFSISNAVQLTII